MKKTGLLHADLSGVIARMGHGDMLVIGDAGLPVPPGIPCIDLALTHGIPSFAQVLAAVLTELQVERCTMAQEASAGLHALAPLPPALMSHDAFKVLTRDARAVVRTGEVTPYANIVLHAGVTF
ncbi:D-ribose pyranase [Loktanella fryxellensis]|uniref:D-ribose pyranase n=1 Tax=Loktanella fryxellensis TaxID=245187 RepID=A0A1H7YU05_9RHOB|nr:D-ribose pyranase [Loktanella fryxellensis]SEM49411.1 D-ribose pyranase [Loktanella fryxellensis]